MILLICERADGGPYPLHFEKMWFDDGSLSPLLKAWWDNLVVKLNGLKEKSHVWNKEVYGHVETKIKQQLDSIIKINRTEEVQAISIQEAIERKASKSRLVVLLRMREIKWMQKSREADVKDGDWNTTSFRKLANARER